MSEPHMFVCGGLPPGVAGRGTGSAPRLKTLSIGKGDHDAHLAISTLTARLQSNTSDIAADLIELATYVYVADQMVTRGGTIEFEYGKHWKRQFRFFIPVRRPEIWNRSDVATALRDVLEFLGDDHYEFSFFQHPRPAEWPSYLTGSLEDSESGDFEEVVLFSGGLDSLGGAVEEVLAGQRKTVLVSHRPVSRMFARQRELVDAIRQRLPKPSCRPLHVAIEANKGKPLNHSFTQRSRSFLFASFGAVVARAVGRPRFRFYENGVTSLNLPVDSELLGARASRTTHPKTLVGFAKLFTLLFDTPIAVENPYLWYTKAQVFERIRALGHGDLCRLTCSCVHTWDRPGEFPHCGRCSQCVDRRLSALAAGAGPAHDDPNGYESDVILGTREYADLTYVERYTGFALDFERIATVREFMERYPQVNRVTPYLGMPATEGVEKIFDLLSRHSEKIREALGTLPAAHREVLVRQSYPSNSLLGVVMGRNSPRPEVTENGPEPMPQRCQELMVDLDRLEVRCGARSCFLGSGMEFRLVQRLIRAKGKYLRIATLGDDVWGDAGVRKNTVQRTASNLRRRLQEAGLADFKIDGQEPDHYRLIFQSIATD